MTRVRARGEDIRRFILATIQKSGSDVATLTAENFGITRQAVNKHLQRLTREKAIIPAGKTRNRAYRLGSLSEWKKSYVIEEGVTEDTGWRDAQPIMENLPDNVRDIWHYCFTEMFNNAIDHSGGTHIFVQIIKTAIDTQIAINDNGIGIFKKIQSSLGLADPRHAVLELSKGKLTTDPQNHTGQGIFFTSRMVDSFDIISAGASMGHIFGHEEDWVFERSEAIAGTSIFMKLDNHTARTAKKIFDEYSDQDDFGFIKTVVPVKLAQYGNDKLISRSQAKRVLARVELFKTVLLNFEGVDSIGQAFADEIFRVFARNHPDIEVHAIKANEEIQKMIQAARAQKHTEELPTKQSPFLEP
jgi:anti-sigma regulatory factor (Ser/Thr protein kinase)/biotin operon repressor